MVELRNLKERVSYDFFDAVHAFDCYIGVNLFWQDVEQWDDFLNCHDFSIEW